MQIDLRTYLLNYLLCAYSMSSTDHADNVVDHGHNYD